ncbi:hypothetical protein E4U53_002234 [Claviceps sorghi]|nr:hypothetical protein E4U53_002234 [Claviceps sorghi]
MSEKAEKPQREPQAPSALPINNTRFRRLLTLLAFRTTRFFYKRDQSCYPLSSRHILKKGPRVDLTEAATMEFVASRTSIPVPCVYCSFVRKGETYIVMERIRGKTFGEASRWLTWAQRELIFAQLREMVQELRSLQPPGPVIGSFFGGSLCDCRMSNKSTRFGPFPSTRDFHRWLREDFHPDQHPEHEDSEDWDEAKLMVALQDREDWAPPVFTHCDLHPMNILVRDGKVVGVVDWEMSGWWPSYWEYTSAWLGNQVRLGWQENIHKFIDPCPVELNMERIRQRWWGEF